MGEEGADHGDSDDEGGASHWKIPEKVVLRPLNRTGGRFQPGKRRKVKKISSGQIDTMNLPIAIDKKTRGARKARLGVQIRRGEWEDYPAMEKAKGAIISLPRETWRERRRIAT